jgi:multiple sugar transport system ATP-binding protein
MAAIEIRDVAKRFGSFSALVNIDLDVADREFLVLLGASGCGKTTLLRLIAGLDTPSAGEIRIGGKRVNELPPRSRGIAMVFQNYAVFPHLTAFENIAFGLRMKRMTQTEIDQRVTRSAALMHIEQLLARYSSQLSGGQRQRVAVARALAMEPEVLLMDEPLSNLDALLRLEMRAELKGVVHASRTTTIYVTHDQVEAMSLADRIAVMDKGRIVQDATPLEIYRNPATRFIGSFIGSPPMNFLSARRHNGRWRVADIDLAGPAGDRAEIDFGIRPEDLTATAGGLTGRVRVVEPLGAHQLVTMTVADTLFRAVLDSDLAIKPGDALSLKPRPERVRWFDPATGAAIPWAPHETEST